MSREEWDETMKSAVSSTLENMAFMEVLPCDEPPESYDNVMQVTLPQGRSFFSTHVGRSMTIRVPWE